MRKDFFTNLNPSTNSNEHWLRLIRDRRWSRAQKRQLLHHFQGPEPILSEPVGQLCSIIGAKPRNISSRVEDGTVQSDLAWLDTKNHHLITILDSRYPPLLREIHDAPLALFAVGNIKLLCEPQVAVVGSRKPTPVGGKITQQICGDLATMGVAVTSGMALGVDGIAHWSALDKGGVGIAVLGNGLDTIYPARNRALFNQLSADGLLVSEYPLGVKPSRYTFPQRNRIVSGLSYGVVIVEAAERSGTLITARLALEQSRELMVVPGSALSEQYKGSHRLLREGAALVSCGEDVVHCLSRPLSQFLQEVKANHGGGETPKAASQHPLLEHISVESTSLDYIIQSSQLTSSEVSSMLLELELNGEVAMVSDGGYVNLS